ncbi:MAG: hypothetical protein PHZ09_03925 [Eubacteriales bacterium]|nr:hypothetical protein [Eubacteriales bacterium]
MIKKLLVKAASTAMIFLLLSALIIPASAMGDIKYDISGVNTAPIQDGVITVDEYGGNNPIVLDGSGTNTESGGWVGEWESQVIKYYFTWDADNLYIGITVQGDTSESQNGPAGDDWFRKGDMVQIGFNPNYELTGCHPIILGIGLTADTQPVVRGDAFRSVTDGEQTVDITEEIKGYSKKYSPSDINYSCEIVVPWHDYVFVNGVGRSSDGAPHYDLSGLKAEENLEIGLWLVYVDDFDGPDGTEGDRCYRTDQTTGGGWVAEEMSSLALVLKNAPAIEVPETEEIVAETSAAPQTSDNTVVLAIVILLTGAAVGFYGKNKKAIKR